MRSCSHSNLLGGKSVCEGFQSFLSIRCPTFKIESVPYLIHSKSLLVSVRHPLAPPRRGKSKGRQLWPSITGCPSHGLTFPFPSQELLVTEPGLQPVCQLCQLGAVPSHIAHTLHCQGRPCRAPTLHNTELCVFSSFLTVKQFRGWLAQSDGVATGQSRSQSQPHIPVPSRAERGLPVPHVCPTGCPCPLAPPSQGSSSSPVPAQSRAQQRHSPAPARLCRAQTKLLVLAQHATRPCHPAGQLFAKKSFRACLCLNTPNSFGKMWDLSAKVLINAV